MIKEKKIQDKMNGRKQTIKKGKDKECKEWSNSQGISKRRKKRRHSQSCLVPLIIFLNILSYVVFSSFPLLTDSS